MKYSIQGSVYTTDGTDILSLLNQKVLAKLEYNQNPSYWPAPTSPAPVSIFVFTAWVALPLDKDQLYTGLKNLMTSKGLYGRVQWHVCSHDEAQPTPCVVTDFYERLVT